MLRTQKTQHKNISRVARKNYIYIYIQRERERERERVITFFLMGEEFKTKIHYPIVKMQERIINPQKGNQKKKKNL